MKNVNWDEVQDEVKRAAPGGYAVRIVRVEDNEQKEYLQVEWEFAEGELKGTNQETFNRFGFWPMPFFCSYKDKALRFFKGFKTAVEMSNRGYQFRNDPQSLVGKYLGVVLGEEEYRANDGSIKKRLYVAEKRSGKAIRDGDFKIPELKKLASSAGSAPASSTVSDFGLLDDDDADVPF